MTTAVAPPPGPPPVEGAQWNGENFFVYNASTNNWDLVPPAPTTPPLPPAGTTSGDKPRPQMVTGTLGDFWDQPAAQGGSGKTWKFHQKPVGTSYRGIVASDMAVRVVAQTDGEGNVIEQNGQKKWQMLVPMLVMPEGDYTDGRATAVFKAGDARDKLNAAMASVNAPLTTDEATGRSGYVPQPGAFIQMTKVADQQGKTSKGEGFTKYIYEVHYRNPDDPNIVAIRAEIEAAVAAIEDAPPPPEMKYNHITKQWEVVQPTAQPASAPALPTPTVPPVPAATSVPASAPAPPASSAGVPGIPPAASTAPAVPTLPATPAPAVPTLPATPAAPPVPPAASAPAVPAVGDPAQSVEAIQAAARHVVTADGSTVLSNGATAPAPAPAPQITREQWLQMPPPVRPVVSDKTGVPIPADVDPNNPAFAGR
jgi:hypothetical protein